MNDCRIDVETNQYLNSLWECDCENESEICDNCFLADCEYFDED